MENPITHSQEDKLSACHFEKIISNQNAPEI